MDRKYSIDQRGVHAGVIPEVRRYRSMTADSPEWAPEAFIEGAPHSDDGFILGFEQAIRNQAAFYIANGHRLIGAEAMESAACNRTPMAFSNVSKVTLAGATLGSFLVADYFDIALGGKDEIEDLDDGNTPIVSTSEFNNGVTTWRTPNITYDPHAITVATDGSTRSSFVQDSPFMRFIRSPSFDPSLASLFPPTPCTTSPIYSAKSDGDMYTHANSERHA
jgi:hypothetical protein